MRLYREFTTQEQIDAQYDIESILDMDTYGKWFHDHSSGCVS